MSLLNNGVTFLHFDETYQLQNKLHSYSHEDIDFRHLEHSNLYCEKSALQHIQAQLCNRKQKGITFIGSGNYHYVSYLLIQEVLKPFTLILFDHHTDMNLSPSQEGNMISCGSWVSFALRNNDMLQKVIIVGPSSFQIHSSEHSKIEIFPVEGSHTVSLHTILSHIKTDTIYISVDKDVLDPKDTVTNWDQGHMKLSTLLSYIRSMIYKKEVYGIDICGEMPVSPPQIFIPKYQEAITQNEMANIQILNTILQTYKQYSSVK
ncbi:arginase family protein [Bacillus cytotoxicus]|uniref:arginase family protein n=1 Tax=Bacillus cereus group sp. BfR-BA-01492 TaxID=2920361 RepID=UPI001F573A70|nr:arginase family protein [Bacillus cereus group sp. BfR-BA-01492]EMA6343962.1 arginase family protein [Bacillus cytotoxicus]